MLRKYEATTAKYNLNDNASASALQAKLQNAQLQESAMELQLEAYKKEISGYEHCVKIMTHIDAAHGHHDQKAAASLESIKKASRQREEH